MFEMLYLVIEKVKFLNLNINQASAKLGIAELR